MPVPASQAASWTVTTNMYAAASLQLGTLQLQRSHQVTAHPFPGIPTPASESLHTRSLSVPPYSSCTAITLPAIQYQYHLTAITLPATHSSNLADLQLATKTSEFWKSPPEVGNELEMEIYAQKLVTHVRASAHRCASCVEFARRRVWASMRATRASRVELTSSAVFGGRSTCVRQSVRPTPTTVTCTPYSRPVRTWMSKASRSYHLHTAGVFRIGLPRRLFSDATQLSCNKTETRPMLNWFKVARNSLDKHLVCDSSSISTVHAHANCFHWGWPWVVAKEVCHYIWLYW